MPRQPRIDQKGLLYHVIARGIERRQIFSDDADRDLFLARMGCLAQETGIGLYAFALIPNHFHLLVRRGPVPLSSFMQRLLTAYAIYYNRKTRRSGHLFQNRYKTVICEDDRYFTELVRYISLNPLRAGLVADVGALESYEYSSYAYILGKYEVEWFDAGPVLSFFGKSSGAAEKVFKEHISRGQTEGGCDLAGGGLRCSLGLSGKLPRERQAHDERTLGGGDFVEAIHVAINQPVPAIDEPPAAVIAETCARFDITLAELVSGSRDRMVSSARHHAVHSMARRCSISKSDIARNLSISLPAVLYILRKE